MPDSSAAKVKEEPKANTAKKDIDLRVVLRDSDHNKRARAILRDHQHSVGMTAAEFAVELSKELHGRIAMTTLSGYKTGRSNVPGAVLLAASAIAARDPSLQQERIAQHGAPPEPPYLLVEDHNGGIATYPLHGNDGEKPDWGCDAGGIWINYPDTHSLHIPLTSIRTWEFYDVKKYGY